MGARAIIALLSGLALFACAGGGAPTEEAATVRTVFTVEGMHCDGCSSSITGALESADGVVTASADHVGGTAEAVYAEGSVEPEYLKGEIEKLGYTVTGWRTEPPTT